LYHHKDKNKYKNGVEKKSKWGRCGWRLPFVMAAKRLKRQGARNGFSSDLNTNTTADNQVEQKRKWFVAMAKPACVVLHMVHTTRKMAGVGSDAYRRVAAVRQDMKNNIAATRWCPFCSFL
jgi:hypothetical protein